jgi:hypothetical protein
MDTGTIMNKLILAILLSLNMLPCGADEYRYEVEVREPCERRCERRDIFLLKGPLTEREAEEVLRAMREHRCVTIDGVEYVFRK